MLKAPYLIFGFDVAPGTPQPEAVMQRAYGALPPLPGHGSLGVQNVFYVEG